ncbi:hypothetical protein DFP83_1383, partial [Idiomarina fontislapidosi]
MSASRPETFNKLFMPQVKSIFSLSMTSNT